MVFLRVDSLTSLRKLRLILNWLILLLSKLTSFMNLGLMFNVYDGLYGSLTVSSPTSSSLLNEVPFSYEASMKSVSSTMYLPSGISLIFSLFKRTLARCRWITINSELEVEPLFFKRLNVFSSSRDIPSDEYALSKPLLAESVSGIFERSTSFSV